MMEYINAQESAKFLFKHRQNKSSINDLPNQLTPKNDNEAYIIQEELKLLYLSLKDISGSINGLENFLEEIFFGSTS